MTPVKHLHARLALCSQWCSWWCQGAGCPLPPRNIYRGVETTNSVTQLFVMQICAKYINHLLVQTAVHLTTASLQTWSDCSQKTFYISRMLQNEVAKRLTWVGWHQICVRDTRRYSSCSFSWQRCPTHTIPIHWLHQRPMKDCGMKQMTPSCGRPRLRSWIISRTKLHRTGITSELSQDNNPYNIIMRQLYINYVVMQIRNPNIASANLHCELGDQPICPNAQLSPMLGE